MASTSARLYYDALYCIYRQCDLLSSECLARTCRAMYTRRDRHARNIMMLSPDIQAAFSGRIQRDYIYVNSYQIRCGYVELCFSRDRFIRYAVYDPESLTPLIQLVTIVQPIAHQKSIVTPSPQYLPRYLRKFANIVTQRFIRDFVTYVFNYEWWHQYGNTHYSKLAECIITHSPEAACRKCTYLRFVRYLKTVLDAARKQPGEEGFTPRSGASTASS